MVYIEIYSIYLIIRTYEHIFNTFLFQTNTDLKWDMVSWPKDIFLLIQKHTDLQWGKVSSSKTVVKQKPIVKKKIKKNSFEVGYGFRPNAEGHDVPCQRNLLHFRCVCV